MDSSLSKSKARGAASRKPHPSTGAQRLYAALRHSIIALEVEPGATLEEERLCRKHKVSRTPMREALIRLASEGLVELEPNCSARVAALQFVDVVDHYEAMDVFQPVIWHFAAIRRTNSDLVAIREHLAALRIAIIGGDSEAIIQTNYEFHCAIAAASHNRSLEKAYRQMLVDKLRVGQHAARDLAQSGGSTLSKRFSGALRIIQQLVEVIANRDGVNAERLARDYNTHVREQIVDILSTSLAKEIGHVSAPSDTSGVALLIRRPQS
jgi:DNA-binding GntR family transcriptional regulator